MKKYLLPEGGQFYKANLHCHSTVSDGRLTPAELKDYYMSMGYSIIAYTDHDVFVQHHNLTDEHFLALGGFELCINEKGKDWGHTRTCHFNGIALDPDTYDHPWYGKEHPFRGICQDRGPDSPHYDPETISEMMTTVADKGFFVTYNHPVWSKETHEEYLHYRGMHAMEIENYGSFVAGYEDYVPYIYDDFLQHGIRLFPVAADDNHNSLPQDDPRSDAGGGFVMIRAEKLEYRTITAALMHGDFYASEGPQIHELWVEDGRVHIVASPAAQISMQSDAREFASTRAVGENPVTEGDFLIPPTATYIRLTVTDHRGKHANTRAYFTAEF